MCRSDVGQGLHLFQQLRIDDANSTQAACEHGFKANARNLIDGIQTAVFRIGQLLQANAHGRCVIRYVLSTFRSMIANFHDTMAFRFPNAINAASRKLSLVRQIKQSVLETRGTQIGYQNLHVVLRPP